MRHLSGVAPLGALLIAGAMLPAIAQGEAPGNDWELSAGVTHRRLVERTDSGSRLLTERGPMLRLSLEREMRWSGGSALRIEAAAAFGELDYDGPTQSLTTRSDHRDLSLGLAWRPLAQGSWRAPWLVLQALQQRRQIESTANVVGPHETSMLWMAGLRWTAAFDAVGWRWTPLAQARVSAAHQLDVDFRGVYDATSFEAGRRRDVRLGLVVGRPDSPWSLRAQWMRTWQSASDSRPLYRAGVSTGTVRHPRITINDFGVELRRAF